MKDARRGGKGGRATNGPRVDAPLPAALGGFQFRRQGRKVLLRWHSRPRSSVQSKAMHTVLFENQAHSRHRHQPL